ncbi:MAG: hypothetical protein AMXMBFR58_18130 [Phycisphaerae bacterium]|nr:hypothetical protein [Phycisphaerales bacterium]
MYAEAAWTGATDIMEKLRKFINDRPWLGWAFAGVILVVSLFVYRALSGKNDPYSVDRLSEIVTLKCAETGFEWQMTRGEMERELRSRVGMAKPEDGLQNPQTGKFTGFPFDKSEWTETIERLNGERQEVINRRKNQSTGKQAAPAGK